MTSLRVHDTRRIAAAFSLALLIALTLPFGAGAAEKVRTDAGKLPGYTATSTAAPLSMLLYEPVAPVPVEPGEPHGEGSLSYTSAALETGPIARAVASSFWPGAAVGDGFATLCDQITNDKRNPNRQECKEEYAVKADARYPSSKQFPEEEKQQVDPVGAGMYASALGLDVLSRASSAESPSEEAMGLGNARSQSETTVERNTAISTTVSSVENVALGGGVITIDSVKTTLEATSDAKKGTTQGETKVNGLVIGGQGYVIDEKGLRPVEGDKAKDPVAPLPTMPGSKEMSKQLGIEITLAEHEKDIAGADASRSAGGLRISIRTQVLKEAVTENLPIDDILGELPKEFDELKANLAALRALAPQVDFVFARGAVRAAGAEEIEFDFPPLKGPEPLLPPEPPAPPAEPPVSSGGTPDLGTGSTPPDTGGSAPAPDLAPGSGAAPAGRAAAPQPVAAPAPPVQPAGARVPDFFGGLPPGLVAAGLALAGLGGRGLAGLSGMAMGGGGGGLCDRGLRRTVPNLRAQG